MNGTGPFTDTIRKMGDDDSKPICQPAVGVSDGERRRDGNGRIKVHIVLPGYYSPSNTGLLDPSTSDGRVIFFLPWEKHTVAGEIQ